MPTKIHKRPRVSITLETKDWGAGKLQTQRQRELTLAMSLSVTDLEIYTYSLNRKRRVSSKEAMKNEFSFTIYGPTA